MLLLLFPRSASERAPQFFRGLKRDGLQQAALAAIVATTGLAVAYAVSRMFLYDGGTAAGLIAGSLTESATIGTASDAIVRLGLPDAATTAMINRIPVAFAVTYVIGVVGAAAFLAYAAPLIMGVDLEEECRRYESELRGNHPVESIARRDVEYRAYMVLANSPLIGRHIRALEALASKSRLFVERIRRRDQVIDPDESTKIECGDTLAITGRRELLVARIDETALGVNEVDDEPFWISRLRSSTSS